MKLRSFMLIAGVVAIGFALGFLLRHRQPPAGPTLAGPPPGVVTKTPPGGDPASPVPRRLDEPVVAVVLDEVEKAARTEPTFYPRPAEEWQGMLVSSDHRQTCERSEQCGLALACREDQLCGACRTDSDCAAGEGCALDHCMAAASMACHRTADCKDDEVCVLSGYSADVRGNGDLRAFCLPKHGTRELEPTPEATYAPAPAMPVKPSDLYDSLRD